MNTIFVSGHLGKDAHVKVQENGYLLTFKMAHSEEWKDNNGIEHAHITWWTVSKKYDTNPKQILSQLQEGSKVLVKGEPSMKHLDVNGKVNLNCSIKGENIHILSSQPAELVAAHNEKWNAAEVLAS
tara:strand:- start:6 stop:386 length:381 start_codon:yes stop_codon:yes gene_type:complete